MAHSLAVERKSQMASQTGTHSRNHDFGTQPNSIFNRAPNLRYETQGSVKVNTSSMESLPPLNSNYASIINSARGSIGNY